MTLQAYLTSAQRFATETLRRRPARVGSWTPQTAPDPTRRYRLLASGGIFPPMPSFVFRCVKCGHAFEELVRGDQAPACPKCAAEDAERQFPLSVTVSTPKSRARTSGIARRAAKAVHRDRQVADTDSLRHHLKEHNDGG